MITISSEAETKNIAQELAAHLQPGDVICLSGDLGVGKTVFARALIRALMNEADLNVPSPTFTLLQTYEADKASIYHYDLYRIKEPEEIYELDWDSALYDGITLIEWPQRLGVLMPTDYLAFTLKHDTDTPERRVISYEAFGSWLARIDDIEFKQNG